MIRKRWSKNCRKRCILLFPPSPLLPCSRVQVFSEHFRSGLTDNSRIEKETNKCGQSQNRLTSYCGSFLFFLCFYLYATRSFRLDRLFVRQHVYIYATWRINHWDVMSSLKGEKRHIFCERMQSDSLSKARL